jgi:pyruvate dehydrogenase E2 component (dihydrolipoamide acetyltransferase)
MAEYIVMPKLGFDMREGVLVSWSRDVGDKIEKGDVVAEIESDKATLELESQASGTLLKLLASEGDVVPIGGQLAIVGEEGEDIAAMLAEGGSSAPPAGESAKAESTATQVEPRPETAVSDNNGQFPAGIRATPVARRLALERGIDLALVTGTGPSGRIRRADVENYSPVAPASAPAPVTLPVMGPESEEVVLSRLRQTIARRMIESKTTVPHFYVTTDVDMAPAMDLREEINALLPAEKKVTVNDMIVKAAALALRSYPNLNASFAGDKIVRQGRINVGSAVAVESGLLTVVQKDTDRASLAQIAFDHKEMIARARGGKSRPSDFEGGTFTVSNLGAFDVDHFIAIINPPEAAILAVGTATQQPVVVDGKLAIGLRMKATISADHRVTDGAEAAQFMQEFKSIIEQPLRLML